MGVKALDQKPTVCSLRDLIENLRDKTPDWYEAKILESLAEIKGNLEFYDKSLFNEDVNLPSMSIVETPYFYNREKARLKFLKFFQESLAQILTHNNQEVRKLGTELGSYLNDSFPQLDQTGEKLNALLSSQQTLVTNLKEKLSKELSQISKVDEDSSCMSKVDLTSFKIKAGTKIKVNNQEVLLDETIVKLKRPKKGTNYLVYATDQGAIEVVDDYLTDSNKSLIGCSLI